MFELVIDLDPELIEGRYQHVHHADSLRLFELGRLALLADNNTPQEELLEDGLLTVITHINVHYKREVKQGSVRVTCEDVKVGEKVISLKQKLYNERGKLAVEAELELMVIDEKQRRSIPVPEKIRKGLVGTA